MSGNVDLTQLAIDREPNKQPPKGKRAFVTRYLLPALLLLGFLALVGWAARDMVFPPTPVTVVPVFSSTSEVRQEGAELFQAAGWVEPRPTPIRVAALAPGVVEEMLVVEDQELKKGDPIAELVKDDARLAHQRALADMALQEARMDEINAELTATKTRFEQPVHLEAALAAASAQLAVVETNIQDLPFQLRSAEADYAALDQDYRGKVSARGVVSGTQIDIAKGKAAAAEARVKEYQNRKQSLEKERTANTQRRDALKTQLALLTDEIRARDAAAARLKQCAAQLRHTQVAVEETQLALDRMTVRAPVDGRVYLLVGQPGSRLGSGMTQVLGYDGSTIITMYQPHRLQVRVDVRFEDLPRVHVKQPVVIKNASHPGEVIGEVLFVSSEADIQKNTVEVKVGITDPPSLFRPEMLVDVTFREPKREQAPIQTKSELRIYVPESLVIRNGDSCSIWVADQSSGTGSRRAIEIGQQADAGMVEVTSGLTVASRLIVAGRESLNPGDRIRVTGEASAAP